MVLVITSIVFLTVREFRNWGFPVPNLLSREDVDAVKRTTAFSCEKLSSAKLPKTMQPIDFYRPVTLSTETQRNTRDTAKPIYFRTASFDRCALISFVAVQRCELRRRDFVGVWLKNYTGSVRKIRVHLDN